MKKALKPEIKDDITTLSKRVDVLVETVASGFALMKARFEDVDQRFDSMDERFDGMDQRFDEADARFDRIEEVVLHTNHRIDSLIVPALDEHAARLKRLETSAFA
jgi:hypothetical protein